MDAIQPTDAAPTSVVAPVQPTNEPGTNAARDAESLVHVIGPAEKRASKQSVLAAMGQGFQAPTKAFGVIPKTAAVMAITLGTFIYELYECYEALAPHSTTSHIVTTTTTDSETGMSTTVTTANSPATSGAGFANGLLAGTSALFALLAFMGLCRMRWEVYRNTGQDGIGHKLIRVWAQQHHVVFAYICIAGVLDLAAFVWDSARCIATASSAQVDVHATTAGEMNSTAVNITATSLKHSLDAAEAGLGCISWYMIVCRCLLKIATWTVLIYGNNIVRAFLHKRNDLEISSPKSPRLEDAAPLLIR